MFKENDFPFLRRNSKGGAFDFKYAMKHTAPKQISFFASASKDYHVAEVPLKTLNMRFLIYHKQDVGEISRSTFDNQDIHNKLV